MRSKVAGALLSGLVFPGIGQWYLGRRARGAALLATAAVSGGAYARHVLQTADAIADKVLGGSLPFDPIAIAAQLDAVPTPGWVTVAGAVFLACWVGSIVEALTVRAL